MVSLSILCNKLVNVSCVANIIGNETIFNTLIWRHNEHDGVSNHQPYDCLLNSLFGRRSKKTSKFRVTGLCAGNSPGTGEFPAQMTSNAENVSIWWRLHDSDISVWRPPSKLCLQCELLCLCVHQLKELRLELWTEMSSTGRKPSLV